MLDRRDFLVAGAATAAGFAFAPLARGQEPAKEGRKKLAVVTTLWNYRSHAWHMAERFLGGYPLKGKWHRPPFDVVSAYVDQRPEGDLSAKRAAESGFKVYGSVAEALRNGGDKLAVDAVLLIGEHGNYPLSEIGQKKYPRYELFQEIVKVFEKDGRTTPVFNDKHLSWNFDWAKKMVEQSKQLGFPFLAGSSLPVTWRMPAIDMPLGAEVEEIVVVAMGNVDIYDFHALETLQCMAERRKGGETGVVSMHALRGPAVWDAMKAGSWKAGGWDPKLFESCLSRSHTLAQAESYSHRYPTQKQIEEFVKEPVAYRFEYADGLKATMLLMNGLVDDFNFAARLKGEKEPLSTLFQLPPNPNVVYSAGLMSKAEEMFTTGKAPYPVERTLLTSGLVSAGMRSLFEGQKKIETPNLAIKYQPAKESQFLRE
ncbi:MAG: twin-arginine translocation signal domain-containing protein [Pirellulaceae bacterium]